MKKYLLNAPVPIPPMRRRTQYAWLALGCFCLLLGGIYLSTVDLSPNEVSSSDEVESAQHQRRPR